MLKEVVRFGVVIGVVLLGFAMAMYALFGGRPDSGDGDSSSSSERGVGDDASDTEGLLGYHRYRRYLRPRSPPLPPSRPRGGDTGPSSPIEIAA